MCVPIVLMVVSLGAVVCPITNRNMRRIIVSHYSLVLSGTIGNPKLLFTCSTVQASWLHREGIEPCGQVGPLLSSHLVEKKMSSSASSCCHRDTWKKDRPHRWNSRDPLLTEEDHPNLKRRCRGRVGVSCSDAFGTTASIDEAR
jgi:hypothetical protein